MVTVTVGDFESIWEAVSQTGPFDICLGEYCVTAPGWGSWYTLTLFFVEMVFWIFAARFAIKKYRQKIDQQKREDPFPPKLVPPSS